MRINKTFDISYTQNRELSWLKFNERVLEEANDEQVPLYERLKFVAIFTSNLNEFFMIRVGSLFDLSLLKKENRENKSLMTPEEQLEKIFHVAKKLYKKRDAVFSLIEERLCYEGLHRVTIRDLTVQEAVDMEKYFENFIAPLLSPQIIDLQHPFPHLANQVLHIAVLLKHKKKVRLGMIPVPSSLPKMIFLPSESIRYILLEEIILAYVNKVFDMYSIIDKSVICVTRNADINPDDEDVEDGEDYLLHVKRTLKKRLRLDPVRLEMETSGDSLIEDYLSKRLKIDRKQIYKTKTPIRLSYVFSLAEKFEYQQKQKIQYEKFQPVSVCDVDKNEQMLAHVLEKDLLLTYPYQKFDLFAKLIKEAAYDEKVVSIKITIYRMGSNKAKLINYLIMAAELGKEVTVLMELRARFDEQNNINWAENLSEAGCNIIYGFEGYKVHSKICLITRLDRGKVQYITQIGTGNYNAQTAAIYTDLSLITAKQDIGKDAVAFFKNMCIANLQGIYKNLLVAPINLKQQILVLIKKEKLKAKAGKRSGIILKMNSLTDREIIDALVVAAQAGVKVTLIIRGICCLVPNVKGKTENVTVISIVGRFLEHSRIFCFGAESQMKVYISSADLMTRNTEKRVEIACPILDTEIKRKIYASIKIMLADNIKGRQLQNDGNYTKRLLHENPIDSQAYFMQAFSEMADQEAGYHVKEN
ncbi:polyphosphate kinase 1 [Anaerosinus massiliensis]|uniref:polyphosphate kinase 1 n=1 Tax=Massilibacillus massiliensis TaxID=1806837 RepID=UPI000A722F84|nr:polyphosphate kinase 1 [Massilibacillus massiliensis]